ncbi:MAG: hypothetical protein F9K40_17560 [Kofleriaceae bacterium]|nr:MAG: hypothetical protein F9K40_17560 [Kofleriaceae bacterium]
MTRKNDDHTASTVAVFGGGALLAWLLLRDGGRATSSPPPAASAAPAPCRVRIRERTIELNGVPSDLPTTIDACRAAGVATLTAAGDAIVGVIAQTGRALHQAGVRVDTSPELRRYVDDAIAAV